MSNPNFNLRKYLKENKISLQTEYSRPLTKVILPGKYSGDYKSEDEVKQDIVKVFEGFLLNGYRLNGDDYRRIEKKFKNSVAGITKDGGYVYPNNVGLDWELHWSLPNLKGVYSMEDFYKELRGSNTNKSLDAYEAIIASIRNPKKIDLYYTKDKKLDR